MEKKKKILAVASDGGHWIQLLRLMPVFEKHDTSFMSTKSSNHEIVKDFPYYVIDDFNRKDMGVVIKTFFKIIKALKEIRPDVIITTGAAPGLLVILAGKLLRIQSLWIESMANVNKISLSGKIAQKLSTQSFTQWEALVNNKFKFNGNVLS